jgi:hypothetical protein
MGRCFFFFFEVQSVTVNVFRIYPTRLKSMSSERLSTAADMRSQRSEGRTSESREVFE